MKYDHGHWDSGKESEQGSAHAPMDPAEFVPGGELHIHREWHGSHLGGVHDSKVGTFHPGQHSADEMSHVADEYLKLLR